MLQQNRDAFAIGLHVSNGIRELVEFSKGPTSVDHIVKPDLVAPGNRTISALGGADSYSSSYPNNKVPLSFYEPNAPSVSLTATTPLATATVSANYFEYLLLAERNQHGGGCGERRSG